MTLIAVTGRGQEDDWRKSTAAGFDRHLVKPVNPETLGSQRICIRVCLTRALATSHLRQSRGIAVEHRSADQASAAQLVSASSSWAELQFDEGSRSATGSIAALRRNSRTVVRPRAARPLRLSGEFSRVVSCCPVVRLDNTLHNRNG